MPVLEIIPITGAPAVTWSRLINHESSLVENKHYFQCLISRCQRLVQSSAANPRLEAWLSLKHRRAAKAAKTQAQKPRAPAGPCNGKQMAGPLTAAGCSQQSRRGNFSFPVIHHRAGSGRGGTEQRLTPDVWPLSNAFAWHIHGSHLYTHVKTHAHTQTQTSENILAHIPVSCLSLAVLFFSAPGRLWKVFSVLERENYCFFHSFNLPDSL